MTQADNNGNSRLDRIESLLLQLSTAVVRHDNQLERIEAGVVANTEAIAQMRQSQDELIRETVEWFGEFTERADRNHEAILEMQSEVKGLQTENRRILERLEQHMSNGHGD